MIRLRDVGEEIKPRIVVKQERLGVSLLRSNIVRSLEWVTDEEDGEVQADEIVIPVLGVELDSVTSRVSRRVGVFSAVSDGGESAEDRGLLADR